RTAAALLRAGAADPGLAGGARRPAPGVAVVDLAVAVVVEAVAGLGRGGDGGDALDDSRRARPGPFGTDARHPGVAGTPGLGIAVVGLAVAVVVEAVAQLRRGGDVGQAHHGSRLARGGPGRADARHA